MKFLLGLLGTAFLLAIWAYRQHVGGKKLAALESGRACMKCGSADVVQEGKGVRCRKCGYFTNLEWLNQSSVSANEVASVQKPDGL